MIRMREDGGQKSEEPFLQPAAELNSEPQNIEPQITKDGIAVLCLFNY
jgi:hypothetical protein